MICLKKAEERVSVDTFEELNMPPCSSMSYVQYQRWLKTIGVVSAGIAGCVLLRQQHMRQDQLVCLIASSILLVCMTVSEAAAHAGRYIICIS